MSTGFRPRGESRNQRFAYPECIPTPNVYSDHLYDLTILPTAEEEERPIEPLDFRTSHVRIENTDHQQTHNSNEIIVFDKPSSPQLPLCLIVFTAIMCVLTLSIVTFIGYRLYLHKSKAWFFVFSGTNIMFLAAYILRKKYLSDQENVMIEEEALRAEAEAYYNELNSLAGRRTFSTVKSRRTVAYSALSKSPSASSFLATEFDETPQSNSARASSRAHSRHRESLQNRESSQSRTHSRAPSASRVSSYLSPTTEAIYTIEDSQSPVPYLMALPTPTTYSDSEAKEGIEGKEERASTSNLVVARPLRGDRAASALKSPRERGRSRSVTSSVDSTAPTTGVLGRRKRDVSTSKSIVSESPAARIRDTSVSGVRGRTNGVASRGLSRSGGINNAGTDVTVLASSMTARKRSMSRVSPTQLSSQSLISEPGKENKKISWRR